MKSFRRVHNCSCPGFEFNILTQLLEGQILNPLPAMWHMRTPKDNPGKNIFETQHHTSLVYKKNKKNKCSYTYVHRSSMLSIMVSMLASNGLPCDIKAPTQDGTSSEQVVPVVFPKISSRFMNGNKQSRK